MNTIDDLQKRIDDGFRSLGDVQEGQAPAREPINIGHTPAEDLSEILDRLDRFQSVIEAAGIGIPALQVPRSTQINVQEFDVLEALNQSDPVAAKQAILLLTTAELIERFGFPTSVRSNERGLFLKYTRIGANGEGWSASFLVKDGFVINYFPQSQGG